MKNRVFSANFFFVLFTVAIAAFLILPSLLQHGMFMDGTQYAVVSRNLAENKGTFWFPYLSSSWEKQGQHYFLEHPPLVYALQSVFFKIFNGSFLSERCYCFVMFLVSAFFIAAIWRSIFEQGSKYRLLFWFPVLLWIITPSVFWSYTNNMHENTVTIFVLAAVYFALKTDRAVRGRYIYIIIAGFCIFLATLSKGVPGAFPLITFLLIHFALKRISWKRAIGYTIILAFVPFLIYFLILYFNESARQSLSFYVTERLLYRINHNGEVENRLSIFFWLFTDLIVPIGLTVLLAFFFKMRGTVKYFVRKDHYFRSTALFFTLVGLAGVIPLALTHVQRAVYFMPALPFFAIAIALLLTHEMIVWIERIDAKQNSVRILSTAVILILTGVITYSYKNFGRISRDKNVLSNVQKIARVTGDNVEILTYKGNYEWGFQFYLLRYHHITLKTDWAYDQFVLIKNKESFSDINYEEVHVGLEGYKLFRKIKGH